MSVADAVSRDLERFPEDLRESALAATALAMARKIDEGRGSPSECAKALMQALGELRELAPPARRKDRLDELGAQRVARIAGGSRATD